MSYDFDPSIFNEPAQSDVMPEEAFETFLARAAKIQGCTP